MYSAVNEMSHSLHHFVIKGRWKIIDTIGKGAFGEVYLAFDDFTKQEVAIKVENPACKKPVLKLEISVMRKLQDCPYTCEFVACGKFTTPHAVMIMGATAPGQAIYSYMVMGLLGPSLSDLRKDCKDGKFSYATTAMLGIQMISAVEALHDIGVIHRDIKPGNFCMSKSASGERATCYLIDFGLSRRYMNSNGRLREPRQVVGFRGTARYASINAHRGLELGRHDDMWSIFYVLVEFLIGQLPWKGKEKDVIGELKQQLTNPDLIRGLPEPILRLFNHINSLTFRDRPNYELMRQCLYDLITYSGKPLDSPYDWERINKPIRSNPVPVPLKGLPQKPIQRYGFQHPAYEIEDEDLSMSADEINKSKAITYQPSQIPSHSNSPFTANHMASFGITSFFGTSQDVGKSFFGSVTQYFSVSPPTVITRQTTLPRDMKQLPIEQAGEDTIDFGSPSGSPETIFPTSSSYSPPKEIDPFRQLFNPDQTQAIYDHQGMGNPLQTPIHRQSSRNYLLHENTEELRNLQYKQQQKHFKQIQQTLVAEESKEKRNYKK